MSQFIAKFSGHHTFPLSYGCLYTFSIPSQKHNCANQTTDTQMSAWRLGKNMVNAIKNSSNRVRVVDEEHKLSPEYKLIRLTHRKKDTVWLMQGY